MEKIREALEAQLSSGRLIAGVGPMSGNCVEAAFSYSHGRKCIIELIASRRQVECSRLGAGYVNNWTTEAFAEYVRGMRKKYPASKMLVCRDHGGPWQGNGGPMPFHKAMEEAKTSYGADISSGFDLVHIDPSLNLDGKGSEERTLSAAFELLSFCAEAADRQGRKMHYEIGTEENVGRAVSLESFDSTLGKISDYCRESGIEMPLFVVGQTGSLVKGNAPGREFRPAVRRPACRVREEARRASQGAQRGLHKRAPDSGEVLIRGARAERGP